jgi:hypothetical protein
MEFGEVGLLPDGFIDKTPQTSATAPVPQL